MLTYSFPQSKTNTNAIDKYLNAGFPRQGGTNLKGGANLLFDQISAWKWRKLNRGARVQIFNIKFLSTRMHSSRMRTGRSLTVCRSLLLGVGGACIWSPSIPPLGVGLDLRVVFQHALRQTPQPPPVNRMTDRCKNITLATTSLRPVITVITRDFAVITRSSVRVVSQVAAATTSRVCARELSTTSG